MSAPRSDARRNFNVSPQAALNPYLRLQNLVAALKEAQPAAEDAAPHLVDYVDLSAQTLWKQMKEAFARDFQETLTKIQWPGKDIVLSGRLESEWMEGVEKLLDLQEPYVRTQLLKPPPSPWLYLAMRLLPERILNCRHACHASVDHIRKDHIISLLSTGQVRGCSGRGCQDLTD